MNVINSSRIQWVDIFKGICITLMVFGHSSAPFITYIYLFHMPAFLIISGYTYHETDISFTKFLKKKIISIVIPYFLINIVFILFYGFLSHRGLYTPELMFNETRYSVLTRIFWLFKSLINPDLGGATWYLPVLFWAQIFYKAAETISKFILHIVRTKHFENMKYVFGIIFGLFGWYFIRKSIVPNYLLDLGLFACLFYTVGVYLRDKKILETSIDNKCNVLISVIVCVFFGSFFFRGELPMNWPTRSFSNLFIQLLSCFCGTYLCYITSKCLESLKFVSILLSYIGKRTYPILILHFLAFKLIFLFLIATHILQAEYFRKLVPDSYPGIQWLLFGVLAIIICLIISKISEISTATDYLINIKIKRRYHYE